MRNLKKFVKDQGGAAAVEYAILVALIAVVIIAAVEPLGTDLSTVFSTVATDLNGV